MGEKTITTAAIVLSGVSRFSSGLTKYSLIEANAREAAGGPADPPRLPNDQMIGHLRRNPRTLCTRSRTESNMGYGVTLVSGWVPVPYNRASYSSGHISADTMLQPGRVRASSLSIS
jgi:hypothetical protein